MVGVGGGGVCHLLTQPPEGDIKANRRDPDHCPPSTRLASTAFKPPIVHNVCERSRGVCVRVRVLCVYCMRTCAQTVSLCVLVQKKTKKNKTVHSNATATAETDLMEGTDFWRQNTKKDRLPSAHPRNGTSSPCWNFQELTLICCVLSCFAAGSFSFFTAASFIADQLRREGRR